MRSARGAGGCGQESADPAHRGGGVELDEADGQELEAGGAERTITVSYRPGRWAREQVYLAIRRERDGEQQRRVLFARSNYRLDWLPYAAKRLEPT